LMCFSL